MKRINIYIILLAVLTLVSCEEKYEAPYQPTDVAWYTSDPQVTEYNFKEGDVFGIIDASQNALSHKWTLEGSGANFLKEGYTKGDSLELFIDEDRLTESEKTNVTILLQEYGTKKVRLYNTFDQYVKFNGVRPLEAVEKDGVWVIDTTFILDVYADMEPAFKVYHITEDEDGNETGKVEVLSVEADYIPSWDDEDEWETIDIEVGERLEFVDLTTKDRPTGREWSINNDNVNEVSTDSAAIIRFSKLGHTVNSLGSFKSIRSSETTVPPSNVSKIIPLRVNVNKSTKNLVANSGEVRTDKKIAIYTTGNIAPIASGVESAFTISYANGSNSGTIAVATAEVNPDDDAQILLTPANPIYFSDDITVTYDATIGEINSTDFRTLKSFTNLGIDNVDISKDLLLDNAKHSDFEGTGAVNTGGAYGYWVGPNTWWARQESDNGVTAPSGVGFMKFEGDLSSNPNALSGMKFAEQRTFVPGKYLVKHKVYVPTGTTLTTLRTDFASLATGWGSSPQMLWDLSGLTKDTWVTIEQEVELEIEMVQGDKNRYSYYIRSAENSGVTGNQVLYLDKMEMYQIDPRP